MGYMQGGWKVSNLNTDLEVNMSCIVCGRSINLVDNLNGRHFCSEECYKNYLWIKEQTDRKPIKKEK